MTLVDRDLLRRTADLAADHLDGLAERRAGASAGVTELVAALGDAPLPAAGVAPEAVIEELARTVAPGLVASPGGRYFGFVTGGALPAALAADWLGRPRGPKHSTAGSSPGPAPGG